MTDWGGVTVFPWKRTHERASLHRFFFTFLPFYLFTLLLFYPFTFKRLASSFSHRMQL